MTDISKISDGNNTYNIKDATARTGLSSKQDVLVSGTNIKTINGNSVLGNGDLSIGGSVDIDEKTITKNTSNELQSVAIINPNTNSGAMSSLKIWQGTEQQWNQGVATTWYYWQTSVTALWIASTLPSSANWQSVTYGDGKFVAVVKDSDKAAYSTDGINWTASTMPSSASWWSVTYGDGKFVAVAYSSTKAAYSTDGINWTASTLPSSASWYSVTYGDGKFVAVVFNSNKSAYSTDGINWTASTLPSSMPWRSVTYGDGKFMAVAGGFDKAAYSTDGINWTASTMPSSASWWSVTYGDGKFVAVAYYDSDASAIFTMSYDECYTLDQIPTTSSQVYSAPEATSTKTITSVGSGTITLSDTLTYNYTSSGNQNTYRTIGDAHPDWLSNINNVGVKIGNTIVATAGGSDSNYTAGTGIDITNDTISVDNTVALKSEIPTVDQTYSSSSTSTNALSHKAIADSKFLQNTATGSFSVSILGGGTTSSSSINIGQFSSILGSYNIAIGNNSAVSLNAQYSIAIGSAANTSANYAIQLGKGTNSEANSFYVGLSDSNNYKLLSSDGTIPNPRLNVMTGADGTNAGTKGAVPAPTATDNTKFLRGDGTWATVSGGGSDVEEYSVAEIEALWNGESE